MANIGEVHYSCPLPITFITPMKYWKFRRGFLTQLIILTNDQQLLFGNYSKRKSNEFINTIETTGLVPKELMGIPLAYIKSVEKGHRNLTP